MMFQNLYLPRLEIHNGNKAFKFGVFDGPAYAGWEYVVDEFKPEKLGFFSKIITGAKSKEEVYFFKNLNYIKLLDGEIYIISNESGNTI